MSAAIPSVSRAAARRPGLARDARSHHGSVGRRAGLDLQGRRASRLPVATAPIRPTDSRGPLRVPTQEACSTSQVRLTASFKLLSQSSLHFSWRTRSSSRWRRGGSRIGRAGEVAVAVVSPHSSSRSVLKCSSSRRSLRCWPPIESTRRSSVGCLDLQWRLAPQQFDSAKPDRLSMLPGRRIWPDDHAPIRGQDARGRGRASDGRIADGCGCDGCDSGGNQQGRRGQQCCVIAAGDGQRGRRRRSAGCGAARVRCRPREAVRRCTAGRHSRGGCDSSVQRPSTRTPCWLRGCGNSGSGNECGSSVARRIPNRPTTARLRPRSVPRRQPLRRCPRPVLLRLRPDRAREIAVVQPS